MTGLPWGHDEATLPGIDELTGPARDPGEVLEGARHVLGIGAPRVRYRDGQPGTGELREALGDEFTP